MTAEGSSPAPDFFEPPESLNIRVAIIGSKGSGKSSLTRALTGNTEQFNPCFLDFYFKGKEGSLDVGVNPYPSLPNVTLLDFPGYTPTDSAAQYLTSIKPNTLHCLVVTVGEIISDNDLQLLMGLKHMGKPYCVVQTHIDLTLHTEKRRQGKEYWRGKTMKELRGRAQDILGGAGLEMDKLFLVSSLEPGSHDFPRMVDYLEEEILQRKSSFIDPPNKQCQELVALFKFNCDQLGLSEFPPLLSNLKDSPPPLPAVIGITGNNKDAILHALSEPPSSALHLRPLPGPGTPPVSPDQYLQNLQLEGCDIYLIVDCNLDSDARATLMEALVASGTRCMLISASESWCKGEGTSRDLKVEKGGHHGGNNVPGLKLALEKGVPQLIRGRVLYALPSIISQLVRRERRSLMAGVYDLCLDICAKASYGQLQEALSSLSSALSSFKNRFGIDEASLAHTGQVTGCPVEDLLSQVQCPLAQDLSTEQLIQMVSQPLPLSALVWSYIPHWGGGETMPKFCTERTYKLLVEAVCGMAEDAERVMMYTCTKHEKPKESPVPCRWPCV
ncbi:uncharacterized protein O3C94_013520 isoform 1-T3 [Discoglossus pictus]